MSEIQVVIIDWICLKCLNWREYCRLMFKIWYKSNITLLLLWCNVSSKVFFLTKLSSVELFGWKTLLLNADLKYLPPMLPHITKQRLYMCLWVYMSVLFFDESIDVVLCSMLIVGHLEHTCHTKQGLLSISVAHNQQNSEVL